MSAEVLEAGAKENFGKIRRVFRKAGVSLRMARAIFPQRAGR